MVFFEKENQPLRAISIHSLCTFWGTKELLREWRRWAEFCYGVFIEICATPDDFCFVHHPAKIISHFPCQCAEVRLQLKDIIAPDNMHVGITNPKMSLQMIWRAITQTGSSSIEIIWLTGRQICVARDYIVDISASYKRCTKFPRVKQIGGTKILQKHIISEGPFCFHHCYRREIYAEKSVEILTLGKNEDA